MPKIIVKIKHIKASKKVGGLIDYVAKREGVDKTVNEQISVVKPTEKQLEFIDKMLSECPDVKKSFEYEDYIENPTKQNASALITTIAENNPDALGNKETYINYIATRPHVEKLSSHGLFGGEENVNLSEVKREIQNINGVVWTPIISLKREDAERLGYDNADMWRSLIRSKQMELDEAKKADKRAEKARQKAEEKGRPVFVPSDPEDVQKRSRQKPGEANPGTSEAGQQTDAERKERRSGPAKKKSNVDRVLDKYKIPHIDDFEKEQVGKMLETIENLNKKDDLIEQILRQSKERKTASHALVKKALDGQDIIFLKETAVQQIFGKIADRTPASMAKKISTYQAISHLLNLKTMNRNIFSNIAFDAVDTTANNVAFFADKIFSIFTKQNTVGLQNMFAKGSLKTASKAAVRQYLDIALDVNHNGSENKYKQTTSGRTFKGKRLGALERAMSYGLQVTDEWQKGLIDNSVRKSFEHLKNCSFSDAEINEIIEFEKKYRTFQDETKLSQMLAGLKNAFNKIGIGDNRMGGHEFGAGDIVQKYTQVPGALITRAVEYSPLGYCKALYNIAEVATRKAEMTPKMQRNISLALARPMTGTGLAALFMWLGKLGIFIGERKDEDKKLKNMQNAEGISNFQLNISALGRLIVGKNPEIQKGDNLVTLGFLEPLNALMAMGYSLSQREGCSVKDWAEVSASRVFDQILDMSTMSTLRSISNTASYGGGLTDVAVGVIADAGTGFVPGPIRQLGNFIDPIQRNPYNGGNNISRAKSRIAAVIPGVRNNVPAKITPFGEEKTTSSGNRFKDFWNDFVNPGYSSIYQPSEVSKELYDLAKISPDVLPNVPAKKFKVDGQEYTLSGKDYEEYSKAVGKNTAKYLRSIMESDDFKKLNDSDKAETLSEPTTKAELESKQPFANGKTSDIISTTDDSAAQSILKFHATFADKRDRLLSGESVNAVLNGEEAYNEDSTDVINSVKKYMVQQIAEKKMTSQECAEKFNAWQSGKIKMPKYSYYEKDLKLSEMNDYQISVMREEILKKVNSGKMSVEDVKTLITSLRNGTGTYKFRIYYDDDYDSMDEKTKEKIMEKLKEKCK